MEGGWESDWNQHSRNMNTGKCRCTKYEVGAEHVRPILSASEGSPGAGGVGASLKQRTRRVCGMETHDL